MPVITRRSGGTYQAREAIANGARVSCTISEDAAAIALARKYYRRDSEVKRLHAYQPPFELTHGQLKIADSGDAQNLPSLRQSGATHIIIS